VEHYQFQHKVIQFQWEVVEQLEQLIALELVPMELIQLFQQ
jgi:hypothetical protein